MNKRRLLCALLAGSILAFALIGAAVQYNPDVIQMLAILGALAGSIAGTVAR